MRELEKLQQMIDEEIEVYAVVIIGSNDYVILPTRYTSVTYRGKEVLAEACTSATTALEPYYNVKCTFLTEAAALEHIKKQTFQLGNITKVTLDLYKYKYPEVFL